MCVCVHRRQTVCFWMGVSVEKHHLIEARIMMLN